MRRERKSDRFQNCLRGARKASYDSKRPPTLDMWEEAASCTAFSFNASAPIFATHVIEQISPYLAKVVLKLMVAIRQSDVLYCLVRLDLASLKLRGISLLLDCLKAKPCRSNNSYLVPNEPKPKLSVCRSKKKGREKKKRPLRVGS